MEFLERIWEMVTLFFSEIITRFERRITALFGSQNARDIKKLESRVEAIGALEPQYQTMTDEDLKQQTDNFRSRLKAGESLEDLLVEAFAVCREGGRRFLGMRH